MSEEEFLKFNSWAVMFRDIATLIVPRTVAPTIRDLAIWLKENGYHSYQVIGVLRTSSIAQARTAALIVRGIMQ